MTATTVALLPLRELVSRRIAWAENRYRQRATGRPTRHANNVSIALTRFLAFAELNAAKATPPFTPSAAHINRFQVRQWLEQMAAERHADGPHAGRQVLSRGTINAYLALLRQAVLWGCENGLVPESVHYDEMQRVRGLRVGEGRENEPRMAADEDPEEWLLRAMCALPHMSRTSHDVVLLLMLSAPNTSGAVGARQGARGPSQSKAAHRAAVVRPGGAGARGVLASGVAVVKGHRRPVAAAFPAVAS